MKACRTFAFVSGVIALAPGLAWFGTAAHAATDEYRFEPTDFVSELPPSILGPDKAVGALIWNHGRDQLQGSSQRPAPPIVLYFSQSGWDSFALRRIAFADRANELRDHLNAAIDSLKGKGYRRILLMGQSAGAWGSIEVGGRRDDVEGVIALAPACCGYQGNSNEWQLNGTALMPLIQRLKRPKVVIAFFNGDKYDPGGRGAGAEQILTTNGANHFIIDRPPYDYMSGHGAGQSWAFARRYASCIYRFMESGTRPNCAAEPAGFAALGLVLPAVAADRDSAFSGLWYGTWAPAGRVAALLVDKASNGKAHGYYAVGPGAAPEREKAETAEVDAAFDAETLRWRGKSAEFAFTLQDTATLAATWTGRNGDKLTASFRRATGP